MVRYLPIIVGLHIFAVRLLLSMEHVVAISSHFTAFPKLPGLESALYLGEENVDSIVTCAGSCIRQNCHCFGYNSRTSTCRLYVQCVFCDLAQPEGDWEYYRIGKGG